MYFRITKGEKGLNIKTYPSNTDKMVTWTGIPATCTPTYPELDKLFWKLQDSRKIVKFCKAEVYPEIIIGTLGIPVKMYQDHYNSASFCIQKDQIIILDPTDFIDHLILQIPLTHYGRPIKMGKFLYDLLNLLIDRDLIFMEQLETKLLQQEEEIEEEEGEKAGDIPYSVQIRKKAFCLYRYYKQLADVGRKLAEDENEYFEEQDRYIFQLFVERVERLASEAKMLQEYSMELWQLHQAKQNEKQNRTMLVLTIISAIFMPLSLVVGWYGMNFINMPELHWKYGYALIAALCGLFLFISLGYLSYKNFFMHPKKEKQKDEQNK